MKKKSVPMTGYCLPKIQCNSAGLVVALFCWQCGTLAAECDTKEGAQECWVQSQIYRLACSACPDSGEETQKLDGWSRGWRCVQGQGHG